jgi:hypothetical protein
VSCREMISAAKSPSERPEHVPYGTWNEMETEEKQDLARRLVKSEVCAVLQVSFAPRPLRPHTRSQPSN